MTKSTAPIWDDYFASREWGQYPPEQIVRFVARNFYRAPDRAAVRLLDVGCGPGCVTSYLAREGFSAVGVDGSKVGLEQADRRLRRDGLKAKFVHADFTKGLPFPDAYFDGTIDSAALCHNPPKALAFALREIHRVLKPGGKHFGMMFAPGLTGGDSGKLIAPNTYQGISEGPIKGPWPTLFADRKQLRELFSPFESLTIDQQSYTEQGGKVTIKHWMVIAVKAAA